MSRLTNAGGDAAAPARSVTRSASLVRASVWRYDHRLSCAADGRDLDRDVVDVGSLHQRHESVAPSRGLLVAEHGLAQQVDVHAEALGAQSGQVPAQRRVLRVGHQVADHGAQAPPRQRDHRAGQVRGEARPAAQQDEVGRGEEGRSDASGQPAQLAGGDARRFGPQHPVAEGHGEGDRARVRRERVEPAALGAFGPGGGGRLEPVPGQVCCRPDQGVRSPVRFLRRTYLPCIGGARTCSQAAGPGAVTHIRCAVRLRARVTSR